MLGIQLQSEELKLLAEKALYWPMQHTLVVSDLHWGKAAHFRKHGIAIPLSAQEADEKRLSALIQKHRIERLIVAGDMFHSTSNKQVEHFAHWRNAHSQLQIDLVIGNHDILVPEQYTNSNIALYTDIMDAGPFLISHDVIESPTKFYIHGHIHPCFVAGGKGRAGIRLQCFCMDDNRIVLPSFGSFTGGHKVSAREYKNIFLVADDEVIQWQ